MSVAPAGLSSSEVDDEEEELAGEWDSLLRLRAGPVQLSKYLEQKNTCIRVKKRNDQYGRNDEFQHIR